MRQQKITNAKNYFSARGIKDDIRFFTAPGRTELGGNHTDHNHGKVLAAAVQFEALAGVVADNHNQITIHSQGFGDELKIELDNLWPVKDEEGKTQSLLRGVAAALKMRGYQIGGFHAYIESDVPVGSGLSSSAAFEVLIGVIQSHLYNCGRISAVEIAQIGQYAENNFFGKPCGLMDQLASSCGGVVAIDFENTSKPIVSNLHLDMDQFPLALMVVNTGGSHADLTGDYAAITSEMFSIAQVFGKKVLRDVDYKSFQVQLPELFKNHSHRALLRAIHFFEENRRVEKMVAALQKNNHQDFLESVRESGKSSFQYLQNGYSLSNPREQQIGLALAATEAFLEGQGACRIHGGGFAGTIQVYLPKNRIEEYKAYIGRIFGTKSAFELKIRNEQAGEV